MQALDSKQKEKTVHLDKQKQQRDELVFITNKIKHPMDYEIATQQTIELDKDIKLTKTIIALKNCYLELYTKQEKNITYLFFKRLSNYIVEATRNVVDVNEEDNKTDETYHLEVCIKSCKGINSTPLILKGKSRAIARDFRDSIITKGNYIDCLNDSQLAQILDKIYSSTNLKKTYNFNKAGLIKSKNLWVYADAAVNLETTELYPSNNQGIIRLPDNNEISLDEGLGHRPYLRYKETVNTKTLAQNLLNTLMNGYNNTIEPLLAYGTAIMSPYRDLFKQEVGGFPLIYLYGTSQGGKSNLLDTIACTFGYDKTFIKSGGGTVPQVWHALKHNNRSPVLLDEIPASYKKETEFETLLKSVYDCKKRGRMKDADRENNQEINGILIMSSNSMPPQKPEVMNRLMFCRFIPSNFDCRKVIPFNKTRDTELSCLLPEILKVKNETILSIFRDFRHSLSDKYPEIGPRDLNNVSIAFTGITILFIIAGIKMPEDIEFNFYSYIEGFNNLYKVDSALDTFLSYLPILKDEGKIKDGKHYTITGNRLKIHLSGIYPLFQKSFRLSEGKDAPGKRELETEASEDPRIIKGKSKTVKTITINGNKHSGLDVDITNDQELLNLSDNLQM